MSSPLTRIDHIGIACRNLDDTVEFYRATYGFEVFHTEVNEEQGVREAMLSAPGDEGGPAIQLLAPLNENSTIAKFIGRNGPGIQQMAFRVKDIDATCAHLRDRGVRLLYDEPRRGTADSRINFVHPKDGGGVLIELVEPAANAAH
jgi:methylmalonyl-CoA/ethylmalonyl-CoA epimerase